jgi:hypothetical protein
MRTLYRYFKLLLTAIFVGQLLSISGHAEQTDTAKPTPAIEDLGGQRYRLGNIIIHKDKGYFDVTGKVVRIEQPLEFLAVAKGGYKAYESLFELNANAVDFNVACILIGLDKEKGKAPEMHFDSNPSQGDAVTISVIIGSGDKMKTYTAAEMLVEGSRVVKNNDWTFTGSSFSPDGQYMAEMDGTLIGFVHDPSSIIEHHLGVGLNKYGAVGANRNITPPVGTAITLRVEKPATQ